MSDNQFITDEEIFTTLERYFEAYSQLVDGWAYAAYVGVEIYLNGQGHLERRTNDFLEFRITDKGRAFYWELKARKLEHALAIAGQLVNDLVNACEPIQKSLLNRVNVLNTYELPALDVRVGDRVNMFTLLPDPYEILDIYPDKILAQKIYHPTGVKEFTPYQVWRILLRKEWQPKE